MVDEATKKTLAAIPLCTTRAGPRDGEQWVARLKEEYTSLIKVYRHIIKHSACAHYTPLCKPFNFLVI